MVAGRGRRMFALARFRENGHVPMHDVLEALELFEVHVAAGEGSLRTWMERVMVNTVLQYLRKNDVMSQSAALDDVPETYEEPDASADTIPQKGIDAVYKRASRRLSYRIQPVCF